MKAIIIHGAFGSPNENWFPWLKRELTKLGLEVFVPTFPTPENQSLESWREVFKDYEQHMGEDTIVIGHSLGPAFLLDVLEKHTAKAAFFASPCLEILGNPEFDEINKTFLERDFDWIKIKENCKQFYLFHGDDDPYVPVGIAERVASKLGVDLVVVKNGGHLNKVAGFTEFKLLLDAIKNVL